MDDTTDTDEETTITIASDAPSMELFAYVLEILKEHWEDERQHVEICGGDLYADLAAEVTTVQAEWEQYGSPEGVNPFLFTDEAQKCYRMGLVEGQMKALRIMSHMIGTQIRRASVVDMVKQMKDMFGDRVQIIPMDAMERFFDDGDGGEST